MFGLIRNAAVIGLIAWHSPVHQDSPEVRLAGLQALPGALLGQASTAAPGLALRAAGSLDPENQEALARRIAQLMRSSGPSSRAEPRPAP